MPEIVQSLNWPFYQYAVLMPEKSREDIFVWFYLSLLVYANEQSGKEWDAFDIEGQDYARDLIKEKLTDIIDNITLENIIRYAKRDYVLKDTTGDIPKSVLKPETKSFLNTFEGVFSSNLQMKQVYQDAITGEVLPLFDELFDPHRFAGKDGCLQLNSKSATLPTSRKIKTAYERYLKLSRTSLPEEDIVDDTKADENKALGAPTENVEQKGFSVIFLDSSRNLYDLKIDLIIEDGEITALTPFDGNRTSLWMTKRYQQALTVCPELAEKDKELREKYPPKHAEENREVDKLFYKKDVASQLAACGVLYRLIESIKSTSCVTQGHVDDLKHFVIRIDRLYTGKSEDCFQQIGKYLECLILPLVSHGSTEKQARAQTIERSFRDQIYNVCKKRQVNPYPLMKSRDLFKNWLNAWDNFKTDLADIVVSNQKFLVCHVYREFLEDAFELYDARSKNAHYKENHQNQPCTQEQLDKLLNVTRAFIDLY